ncbi:ROK family protein [Alloacidobacterium dinghuense]|uniref:ROK family protein n=1 Tax=Alloacidobacterium dinghuense TaxID=2763107 RepID=UPI00255306CD|nr:ROK family protein [Alloacidobacterium dinghuense]
MGGTNLRLALADMAGGAIVAKWSSSTAGSRDANVIIDLIRSGAEELLRQADVPRSALKAVAAGAPGVTNVEAGIVVATSYLLGWRNVPLRDLLEAAFEVPAAVDNDVNLAAIGEYWAGAAKGVRDFVFLAVGTGIGAGIILDGKPFRGMDWSAGEIGYMLVPGVSDGVADTSTPGALEELIGGEGIRAEWRRRWSKGGTSLCKDLTATEIFDGAVSGDALARSILEQSARLLAYAIYNISLVLNCSLFLLGGGVGMHRALGDATRQELEKWRRHGNMQLIHSGLGVDAQLIGAVRLALDTANDRGGIAETAASKVERTFNATRRK